MRPIRDLFLCVVLSLAIFLAFRGVLECEFMWGGWDDDELVYENENLAKGWSDLSWTLRPRAGHWIPLTLFSFVPEYQIAGYEPWTYHAGNLILHIANGCLVFLALTTLTKSWSRSFAVAALFAVHPLRVESVAWVAERKDVLGGFFGLLALLAYVRYAETPSARRYLLVLGLFVLSLLSKPMLLTFPFLLLLLDAWPLQRRERWTKLLAEKAPLLLLSLAFAAITHRAQKDRGFLDMLLPIAPPLGLRLENAIVSYASYVYMTVWPTGLSTLYWFPAKIPVEHIVLSLSLLGAISFFAVWQWKRQPAILIGWLWFLGTLVPMIGIVQMGKQGMADRFSYFPSIGLLVAAVWPVADRMKSWTMPARATLLAVIVTIFGVLTYRQVDQWP